jgi:hypothetical protein
MSRYQQKYWQELYDLKSHANYVRIYLEKSELHDRGLKICLALASSSSIGAWVIWKELSFVWALIIAASQVINAVKEHLPFKTRLKALSGLQSDLEDLLLFAENKWFDVAEGMLTEDEIHKLQFEIRAKKIRLRNKYLKGMTLPDKHAYLKLAEDLAIQDLNNYYLGGNNHVRQ